MLKKYTIFVHFSVLGLLVFSGIIFFAERYEECRQWEYYASTDQPVHSVEEAVEVFRAFLPSEKYYRNYVLPNTVDGYKKRFNIAPFMATITYTTDNKNSVKQDVYNMLLGYALGKDGSVYKYQRC